MAEVEVIHADIPDEFKELRACLRCTLIKTFNQFYENGCDNCLFLDMRENTQKVLQCTTSLFEGCVGLVDPNDSWVAKWQRIGDCVPGMYAVEVIGTLPDDVVEQCEQMGQYVRSTVIEQPESSGPAR